MNAANLTRFRRGALPCPRPTKGNSGSSSMPRKLSARPDGRRIRHQVACAGYAIGLLLIFAFSLYLLPHDTGVGKLLFNSTPDAS